MENRTRTRLSIMLVPEIREWLDEKTSENGLSLSRQIELILRQAKKEHDNKI